MILEVFLLLDLLTAFVLIGAQFNLVSNLILFYHASYLLVKAVWYYKDWLSWIDGIIGIYLLLMILGVKTVFTYIAATYFIYKTIMYFVYRA